MNIVNVIVLLFLLSAFAIGVGIYEIDNGIAIADSAIDNASITIQNISLVDNYSSPTMNSFFLVLEKYIHFIGTFGMEVMRVGIHFGNDNPSYFEPSFIIRIVKMIVVLLIIFLLIKPIFYCLILLVMFVLWLIDRRKKTALTKLKEEKTK